MLKNALKNYFKYFFYFYSFLRYRIFLSFSLSFTKGVLDGFGLAMFIPLLKMANPVENGTGESDLGKLSFLPKFFQYIGIDLNINSILIIILTFFILKGGVAFVEGYVKVIYQQLFIREIRVSNIDLLNSLSFGEFVKSDAGKIQNTFSAEVERVNFAYKSYFKSIEYAVLVLVYVVLAFSANSEFAIIVSIGGFFSNFLFKWLFKKTKALSVKFTKASHSFQGYLIQQVANYKYLKATGLNMRYGDKLKKKITEIEDLQRRIGIVASSLSASREPITILVVIIAILIQVTYFDPDISLIILSLLFLYRAMTFLMSLQEFWNKFLSVSGSLDNMTNFTNELRRNKEKNGIIGFTRFKDKILLEGLSFKYGNKVVINGIDLEIKKNETIAIVGESGSGKSTLMNILAGLLIPTKGSLLIDGRPITDLNLNQYRKRIGYIAQEAPIFSDTVFNNVTFWAEKNTKNLKNFRLATEKASISTFINNLENQEEEIIGNNGINISGGQKQRLSIARELYKDVDFLLMDEATSALDGETESTIKKNIDELKGDYTIIIVAHRLATIKNADRIVLLSNGKIEGIGTFQELIHKSPIFKSMIDLQGMIAE